MANLRHPFIIRLNYAFQTTSHLFYVMDFAPGGELFNRLSILGAFDDDTARFYVIEIGKSNYEFKISPLDGACINSFQE